MMTAEDYREYTAKAAPAFRRILAEYGTAKPYAEDDAGNFYTFPDLVATWSQTSPDVVTITADGDIHDGRGWLDDARLVQLWDWLNNDLHIDGEELTIIEDFYHLRITQHHDTYGFEIVNEAGEVVESRQGLESLYKVSLSVVASGYCIESVEPEMPILMLVRGRVLAKS